MFLTVHKLLYHSGSDRWKNNLMHIQLEVEAES